MTSFQLGITPNRRAAGRFIAHVRRTIQGAFLEERKKTGINQSYIANKLGVDRSVISRELLGRRDISLGRAAEYAWVLGREMIFDFVSPQNAKGINRPISPGTVHSEFSFSSSAWKLDQKHIPDFRIVGF